MTTNLWIDGQPADCVPVLDRGLQYGDGVFRTMLLWDGAIIAQAAQLDHLRFDAEKLGLPAPDLATLRDDLAPVQNIQRGVVKVLLTAGDGARGYARPRQAVRRIVSVSKLPDWPAHYWSQGVRITSLDMRMGRSPLGGVKHLNRLEQVLARSSLPPGQPEGLLLDEQGMLVSGTMSNLFWLAGGRLYTPDVSACGIAGCTRARLLTLAGDLGMSCEVVRCSAQACKDKAERIILGNSLIGLWPVARWDDWSAPETSDTTERQWRQLNELLAHPYQGQAC